MPQVTIGLPVYNGAATIAAALDSLLAQTFDDFLLIVSDNGSTDDTIEICEAYAARDARIRLVRQPANLGAALNFRFVLMEAQTPFFMWAAADDLWAPTFLARNLERLMGDPDLVLSQSRVLFTVEGRPSHLSTGTYPLLGTPHENAIAYFRNPADNSRYYGVFRTEALQRVYPPRTMFGIDWLVAGSTLRYGKHAELPDVLMIRDSSDPRAYARLVAREHNLLLWRIFPMGRMTIDLLRAGHVPRSFKLLGMLLNINLYMHFRFGLYRIESLAEAYVRHGSLKGLGRAMLHRVRAVTAPGLKGRLRTTATRGLRVVERVGLGAWRRLPLPLAARLRIKSGLFHRAPTITQHLESYDGWISPSAMAGGGHPPAPPLPMGGWRSTSLPAAEAKLDLLVVVVASESLVTTLAALEGILEGDTGVARVVVLDLGTTDVTATALATRTDLDYRRPTAARSTVEAVQQVLDAFRAATVVVLGPELTPARGFLAEARRVLRWHDAVAPLVRRTDGTVVSLGGLLTTVRRTSLVVPDDAHWSSGLARRVDFSPAALVARGDAVAATDGLDTHFTFLHTAFAAFGGSLVERGRRCFTADRAVLFDRAPPLDSDHVAALDGEWFQFVMRRSQMLVAADRRQVAARRARLLYVDADTPTPDRNSGSIDALNLMRLLIDLGFSITFVPDSNLAHRGAYTDELLALGVDAVWYPRYVSTDQLLADIGREFVVIVLCRADITARLLPAVRKQAPQARVVFNTVDLHCLRLEREAALNGDTGLARRASRMRASELASIAAADATIVLSRFELDLLAREVPAAKVHLIPLLREIAPELSAPGFDDRADMLFVGTYQHPPNVDAVLFFAREIWPLVRERLPEARFYVVGSEVTPEVQALQDVDGIEVLGFVPDLDALLARCRLSVSPLRYGAGLKGKVSSALAAGVPSVVTSLSIEGSRLVGDEHVLVADDPMAFADAVIRAYTDETLWTRLAKAGFEAVRDDYSLEANQPRLRALLGDVGIDLEPREAGPASVFQPSRFWELLQALNQAAVAKEGRETFKRTINNNYFQWLPSGLEDPQVQSLMRFWLAHPSSWPIQAVAENAHMELPDELRGLDGNNPFTGRPDYPAFYSFFVGLLWHHAASTSLRPLHEMLEEPALGNPLPIRLQGKLISQDLANSITEWSAVERLHGALADPNTRPRVLEVGAGYGRLAYVALATTACRYVIVDIPPAIDIATWYLSELFPEKRVFAPAPDADLAGTATELADADLVLLSPAQITALPDRFCEVGLSISSLHEMRKDQIEFYLGELARIVDRAVYLKQWTIWGNPADDIVVKHSDYRLPDGWDLVIERADAVHSEFTELGFVRRRGSDPAGRPRATALHLCRE